MTTPRTLAILATLSLLAACTPAPTQQVSQPEKKTMTFAELRTLGGDYTCDFEDTDDMGNRTAGTMHFQEGGKNIRGAFTVTQKNGESQMANMLRANDTVYLWSDEEPQGMMMKLDAEDISMFGEQMEGETALDEEGKTEFSCAKWTPEAAMFVPPAEKTFIDLQAQMQMMQQSGMPDDAKKQMCAACDQAPAADKAQCKKALGCDM